LSFANSAPAAGSRLDSEDARELTQMATLLEKCWRDVGQSFSQRDVKESHRSVCAPMPKWIVCET